MDATGNSLREIQAAAGATFGEWFGCQLPSEFAGFDAEYRAARESVALLDKNYRAWFSFTGPDRVRYLNAILTNNIRDLAEGRSIPSLFLNTQGHIIAEMEIWALADRLIAVSYSSVREKLAAQFDKYIIMDDVVMEDQTATTGVLALEGPAAPQALQELCGMDFSALEPLSFSDATVRGIDGGDIPCRIQRRDPGGAPSVEFTVSRSHLPALWRALALSAKMHGGMPAGYRALNALRLEAGIPWFGYDFDESTLPHEAGLENSHISYSKGCYLGQEIVERVRSRGHVNRHLALLEFSGDTVPAQGMELFGEESCAQKAGQAHLPDAAAAQTAKPAGHVTRSSWSPARNRPIAMAYLRREFLTPGGIIRWQYGEADVAGEILPASPQLSSKAWVCTCRRLAAIPRHPIWW